VSGEITAILIDWRRGDVEAVRRLFPLVYDQLRAMAHRQLRKGPRSGTLETAGLVHEAYLKLVEQSRAELNDRQHFFAVACKAMRHILVDYARSRATDKRGGGGIATTLDEGSAAVDPRAVEVIAVDQALGKLEALDPRLVQIVEMRFFGGLSLEETAEALGVSERTARRDWQRARVLLRAELS
jgi:RNA polymerase sigma factor (TIGR02999 family)